ncbi:hypothetical protein [Bacillus velezensis]|uniref:hypothetical protein n=1 Tax=Bacillus velezensis TaxID=492670 RepID=UPI0018E895F3|nr:hypothetical protein [Bacillus velezensis]
MYKSSKGELKQDLLELQGDLIEADDQSKNAAFSKLRDKYKKDVVFDLYIEQLTTIAIEGEAILKVLRTLKHGITML